MTKLNAHFSYYFFPSSFSSCLLIIQERQTKENIAKAEANIKRLLNGGKADAESPDLPPNGDGEKPAEPAPTPSVDGTPASEISVDKVDEQLEDVQEEEA